MSPVLAGRLFTTDPLDTRPPTRKPAAERLMDWPHPPASFTFVLYTAHWQVSEVQRPRLGPVCNTSALPFMKCVRPAAFTTEG